MRWTRSVDSGIYYRVDYYPRGTPNPSSPHVHDYNLAELKALCIEDEYRQWRSMPYPITERQHPNSVSKDMARSIIRAAYPGYDPEAWEVEYRRIMKAEEERRGRLGYGIRNRVNGEPRFIIEPAGTHLGHGYGGGNTGLRSNPPPPPPGEPPPPPPDLHRPRPRPNTVWQPWLPR
jgi:hypothetical protein